MNFSTSQLGFLGAPTPEVFEGDPTPLEVSESWLSLFKPWVVNGADESRGHGVLGRLEEVFIENINENMKKGKKPPKNFGGTIFALHEVHILAIGTSES